MTRGKDHMVVKALLKTYPVDRLREIVRRFFALTPQDDGLIEKAGHTIGVFRSMVVRLARDADSPAERELKRLRAQRESV